jgi:hypothetical protein
MLLRIVFVMLSFSGFSQVTMVARGKSISIEGTAVNLKAGSAVKCKDHYFLIEEKYSWTKEEENKQVSVKGKLQIYLTYVTDKDPTIQYMPTMIVIRKPKIKFLEFKETD